MPSLEREREHFDVAVVGAGFAGLCALYQLRARGLTAHVLEAADDIGGTWYWNRYPGARCDTESLQYSYQFSEDLQQEWSWSEKYATQPEILRYINHVADRFALRPDISLATRVNAMRYSDEAGRWTIETDTARSLTATHCVMATGCLSVPVTPKIEGLERFSGACHHTGTWPHEGVDVAGKRVGIIGTGSSAIQALPVIAAEAAEVTVFQRTPNYSVPAHNQPLDPQYERAFKARYAENRAQAKETFSGLLCHYSERSALEASEQERRREYEARWAAGGLPFFGAFSDITHNAEANATATAFLHDKIRQIVDDPEIAELLVPNGIVGCKRLCVDTDYFATYNRDNVHLVDVRTNPIERITPTGVVVAGREYEVDILVLATGFDAMTGALARIDIRGRDGLALNDKWADGPRSYLGLGVAGFPNFFTVTGPGSPSVLTNMLPTIEQHVDWIADCLVYLRDHDIAEIEPTREAEDSWTAFNERLARATMRYECGSWYLGANVPGKPRVFMPFVAGLPRYIKECEAVVAEGYRGFDLRAATKSRRAPAPVA